MRENATAKAKRPTPDAAKDRRSVVPESGAVAFTDFAPALGATPVQLSALDRALVQFRETVASRTRPREAPSKADVKAVAARGLEGGGATLPHLERIQMAFGRHDVSGIRAHTGAAAQEATRQLGARGYATGQDVVLSDSSDLHTAAHEAAHVVQQRGGVQLSGGVGAVGDRYEQHADAVADAVVAGRSAEGLLDRFAGAAGGEASIQMKAVATVQFDDGGHGGGQLTRKYLAESDRKEREEQAAKDKEKAADEAFTEGRAASRRQAAEDAKKETLSGAERAAVDELVALARKCKSVARAATIRITRRKSTRAFSAGPVHDQLSATMRAFASLERQVRRRSSTLNAMRFRHKQSPRRAAFMTAAKDVRQAYEGVARVQERVSSFLEAIPFEERLKQMDKVYRLKSAVARSERRYRRRKSI